MLAGSAVPRAVAVRHSHRHTVRVFTPAWHPIAHPFEPNSLIPPALRLKASASRPPPAPFSSCIQSTSTVPRTCKLHAFKALPHPLFLRLLEIFARHLISIATSIRPSPADFRRFPRLCLGSTHTHTQTHTTPQERTRVDTFSLICQPVPANDTNRCLSYAACSRCPPFASRAKLYRHNRVGVPISGEVARPSPRCSAVALALVVAYFTLSRAPLLPRYPNIV